MTVEHNENFIQTIQKPEDFVSVAKSIVKDYCSSNNVDESDIYPSVWNDIITELYVKLFKPCNKLLKLSNGMHNEYDISVIEYIYNNIYKRLCNSHCQEVTLKGFLDMTGIHKQSIYDWQSGVLSTQRSDLHEKIMQDNEESLFALMKDRRNNPMKLLPKLNKVHGWNMPGIGAKSNDKQALNANQLPRLDANPQIVHTIADNSSGEMD